jgi:hypothetical protein
MNKFKGLIKNIKFLRVIYLAISLLFFIFLLINYSPASFLWFCRFSLIIFILGLISNNDLFINHVFVSQSYLTLIWIIEVLVYYLFNYSIFNVIFLYQSNLLLIFALFYHIGVVLMSMHLMFLKKKVLKKTWIFSSISFFIIAIFSLVLLKLGFNLPVGINCVSFCPFKLISIVLFYLNKYTYIHQVFLISALMSIYYYFFNKIIYNIYNKFYNQ